MINLKTIKIGIIEDSEIHREWLKLILAENEKIILTSEDALGRNGINSVKQHKPDLVFIDFQLEDMTGLEVSKRIKSYDENVKIFVLTAHTEIAIIDRLINDKAIDAIGIKGSPYLEDNLESSIMDIIEGGGYLDPILLRRLRESKVNCISNLTRREFEVFIQLSQGKPDRQIADDLCVEISHVKNLKSKIMKKITNTEVSRLTKNLKENSSRSKFNEY